MDQWVYWFHWAATSKEQAKTNPSPHGRESVSRATAGAGEPLVSDPRLHNLGTVLRHLCRRYTLKATPQDGRLDGIHGGDSEQHEEVSVAIMVGLWPKLPAANGNQEGWGMSKTWHRSLHPVFHESEKACQSIEHNSSSCLLATLSHMNKLNQLTAEQKRPYYSLMLKSVCTWWFL